jgi:hypothetical protein
MADYGQHLGAVAMPLALPLHAHIQEAGRQQLSHAKFGYLA